MADSKAKNSTANDIVELEAMRKDGFSWHPCQVDLSLGAATTCYVALHLSLKGVSGKYFVDCNELKPSRLARDEILAKRLLDFGTNLVDNAPQ